MGYRFSIRLPCGRYIGYDAPSWLKSAVVIDGTYHFDVYGQTVRFVGKRRLKGKAPTGRHSCLPFNDSEGAQEAQEPSRVGSSLAYFAYFAVPLHRGSEGPNPPNQRNNGDKSAFGGSSFAYFAYFAPSGPLVQTAASPAVRTCRGSPRRAPRGAERTLNPPLARRLVENRRTVERRVLNLRIAWRPNPMQQPCGAGSD